MKKKNLIDLNETFVWYRRPIFPSKSSPGCQLLNKGKVPGFIAQIALTFETNQKDDRPCALQ